MLKCKLYKSNSQFAKTITQTTQLLQANFFTHLTKFQEITSTKKCAVHDEIEIKNNTKLKPKQEHKNCQQQTHSFQKLKKKTTPSKNDLCFCLNHYNDQVIHDKLTLNLNHKRLKKNDE